MSNFTAAHVLEYPYTRSVGPVLGRFLGALKEARIEGIRTASGKVLVPPAEYDPETAATLSQNDGDFVEVGPAGTVQSWTWVVRPNDKQPLGRPFAWALVLLDGADHNNRIAMQSLRHSNRNQGSNIFRPGNLLDRKLLRTFFVTKHRKPFRGSSGGCSKIHWENLW